MVCLMTSPRSSNETLADTIEMLATDEVLRGRARNFAHRKAASTEARWTSVLAANIYNT